MLSEMCERERALSLFVSPRDLQSTTSSKAEDTWNDIAVRPHFKYDSDILIRSDLKVKGVSVWEQDNVELISIEMPGVVVHSVYKPANEKFALSALGNRKLPHIVIGDFNSHSTTWGYTTTYDNGEAVEQWAYSCNLTLIHNAKLPKSFNSERWKRGYNPDLIFVSESIANMCGNQSWSLSLPRNIARSVHVQTR